MAETESKLAEFKEAQDLKDMAQKLIASRIDIDHVDVEEVLFLKEMETQPNASARTYALTGHPIQYFTNKRFCIVFYESNIDYFSYEQRVILLYHELMHIPILGNKLIDHNVKDFREILHLGVDWNLPGVIVPKLIEGGNEEEKKES